MRYPLLLVAAVTKLAAQDAIPVGPIGRTLAVSSENVGVAPSVRATSTGTVIVGSNSRQRVWAFDSTLKQATIIRDSTEGTASRGIGSSLIAYLGDSTLVSDADGAVLLVIDPAGKRARVMAPPRSIDFYNLASSRGGRAGLDNMGRIVYRANPPSDRPRPVSTTAAMSQRAGLPSRPCRSCSIRSCDPTSGRC